MNGMNDSLEDSDLDAAFDSFDDGPVHLPPAMAMPPMAAPSPMPPPLMPTQMPPESVQAAASLQRPQQQPQQQRQQQRRSQPPPQHVQMRQRPQQMSPFTRVLPLPPGFGGQPVAEEAFFVRKIAGLPVWAWGAIAVVGGGVAYYTLRKDGDEPKGKSSAAKKLQPNSNPESKKKNSSDGWQPSRGQFADALTRKFGAKIEKVYDDADVAKGALKTVSPLINLKAKPGFVIDKTFTSFCKTEGLAPVAHDDNEIGFYPAEGTARGREWEEYVNLLRDDGQTV